MVTLSWGPEVLAVSEEPPVKVVSAAERAEAAIVLRRVIQDRLAALEFRERLERLAKSLFNKTLTPNPNDDCSRTWFVAVGG